MFVSYQRRKHSRKLRVLYIEEDKRATFHAMHAALKKNKDTLTRLKLENKEIRNTILAMRKERNVALEQEK